MAKKSHVLTCIICTLMLPACMKGDGSQQIHTSEPSPSNIVEYIKITPEEAKKIMDSGDDYILLDVRTVEEFELSRIEGAILIPDYEIESRAETDLPDKDALILIYCRSGRRSANVANDLICMGYTNVYDFGGIIDWTYDTVSDTYN